MFPRVNQKISIFWVGAFPYSNMHYLVRKHFQPLLFLITFIQLLIILVHASLHWLYNTLWILNIFSQELEYTLIYYLMHLVTFVYIYIVAKILVLLFYIESTIHYFSEKPNACFLVLYTSAIMFLIVKIRFQKSWFSSTIVLLQLLIIDRLF